MVARWRRLGGRQWKRNWKKKEAGRQGMVVAASRPGRQRWQEGRHPSSQWDLLGLTLSVWENKFLPAWVGGWVISISVITLFAAACHLCLCLCLLPAVPLLCILFLPFAVHLFLQEEYTHLHLSLHTPLYFSILLISHLHSCTHTHTRTHMHYFTAAFLLYLLPPAHSYFREGRKEGGCQLL